MKSNNKDTITQSIKLEDWNKPALSVMKEDIFTELTEI